MTPIECDVGGCSEIATVAVDGRLRLNPGGNGPALWIGVEFHLCPGHEAVHDEHHETRNPSEELSPAPDATPKTPYELADYYACEDSDQLEHDTEEEAIERYLDSYMSPTCDVAAIIAEHCPLTVQAWTRKVIPPSVAGYLADRLADELNEWWSDEDYRDPDGDRRDGPGDKKFIHDITPLLSSALERVQVWTCDRTGTKTYELDEVLAMMRSACPGWFEESPTPEPSP